jgi:hypothetical protein
LHLEDSADDNAIGASTFKVIVHVPGGDHPSMIAHPEVTVAAIRDAANAVSR